LLTNRKAESYSWFYLYYWYFKKWPEDWKDTGINSVSEPVTLQGLEVQSASFLVEEDALNSDTAIPDTCRMPETLDSRRNPKIECEYTDPTGSMRLYGTSTPPGPFLSDGGCELS
jgi:hypothetical protein